jgi:pyruvate dehydrogenase E2 component (dihydrolipoamide acetyltransferase)
VVSKALQQYPQFNASLDATNENLIYKKYCNLGIAVETHNGLVVPVIKNVNQLTVIDIAKEMARLSSKAREKGLMPADMSGGCFTISSLGGIGGTAFTPIVNSPEVAILGLSRSSIKPVYQNEHFVPRLMLPLSLSYDHRVIDGAEAARFTRYISDCLADIRKVLL